MVPWSVTMRSTLTLNCVLAMGLFTCIGAITVSIDRSDNKPPPTRSSMIANGWRPLTNGYEETIGTNVSPSSNLERNGPLHPVLGKLQEHMAASEKLKPQRKGKPSSYHDYNPPSILGSFTVLGHAAAKARGEAQSNHNHPNKHVASETREYTFLIPPPKDAYRFDLDQHRKPILRDSSTYLRQPQFGPPVHQPPDPIKAATYFIKGYTSTTNSPSSPSASTKNRHYAEPYVPQLLQPPRYQVKPFESLKVSNNAKPYFQPPGTAPANDFGKDKRLSDYDHRQNHDKYPGQAHNDHVINPASTGNFFSQVNHPSHSFKTSFERDPAFLVHESHEISYITPPSVYNPFNFRPSLPYETLLPPDVYSSSTPAPTTPRTQESSKFQQQNRDPVPDYKRPSQSTTSKQIESGIQSELLPTAGVGNTYYVSEAQDLTPPPSSWPVPKNKYQTSDINEVLPRLNPPSKFNQEPIVSNQIPQAPKVVFIGPQSQQPQFQTSVLPIDIRPESGETEYETPESISLKHFNEQQYLIQQQLLQRDRQRLAEQERQQQLEIEKQQQEELKKRQEELRQLLEQQKEEEEARLAVESARNQTQQLAKVTEEQSPYAIQLAGYEIPKVTTDLTAVITEQSSLGEQPKVQQSQVTQPDYVFSERPTGQGQQYQDHSQNQPEQVNYREQQTDIRPHRPHKPSREHYRRRKPSTTSYEPTPTEAPIQVPETSAPVTLHIEEVPIQTTTRTTPETVTPATVSTQKPRTRRPGSPIRRRRPTTTTPEPVTVPSAEDYLKYEKQEEAIHHVDATKRKRIKPTQSAFEDTVAEKKANIRKRPGHRNRVNPGEPFEAEIVTEIVHTPLNTYKSPTESIQSYNEYATRFVTNQPNQQFDYTSPKFATVEDSTQTIPLEYYTESTKARPEEDPNNESYKPQQDLDVVTNIPLEDLFIKTEGNYFDRTTVLSTSTSISTSPSTSPSVTTIASTTTSTVQSSTQAPPLSSSTSRSHKIRPIRYGNTTRPRFSIKDYKSRMDYKSRLAQISSTEPSATPAPHTKQRGSSLKSQQSQQQNIEGARETTGRYKYVSRVNYRTSSPNPPMVKDQELVAEDTASSTTERTNRFVPKRRPINGNVYRSRISGTTSSPSRSQNHYESDSQSKPSTARAENVFSSSVRRRPVMKSRLSAQRESSTVAYTDRKETEATEMAAEETSFYSSVTTTGTTKVAANEIPVEKEESAPTNELPTRSNVDEEANEAEESETGPSFHPENEKPVGPVHTSTDKSVDESQLKETSIIEQHSTTKTEETTIPNDNKSTEATTTFEVRSEEEELFAKASQSVADLTSSASALYDKPGMFKAVSPESRVIASHFKIPTDEPTLPIEAFFQELSKKS